MLTLARSDLIGLRVVLRPLEAAHAGYFWPILRERALYAWIDRPAPASLAEVEARFARISVRTDPARRDQWLNWSVWTLDGAPLGLVEATAPPNNLVHIAYMFALTHWRQGYAAEAVGAALAAMAGAGATGFEAYIDARNSASIALARRLAFALAAAEPAHAQRWLRAA